ncbi:MAG: energy-coupled thiamine transporter ThiT [Clostridiales bacterium]|nr:energy-coupled thiamine transporter ThiT [Clostridiales bacterium]MBR5358904.1 energy-coupled thiamine transporter ThiT [Clostridiales bacterium]
MSSNKEKILTITCGGVCLALAFVLSRIVLFEMPMGGSVTPASCLPIVVFGMAFGPVWGFAAAFIFSLLQLIGGWLVTPFQVLLDYTLGYTMLGIAGFAGIKAAERQAISNPLKRFRSANLVKAVIFTVLAYAARWFCSVLSGVIFYAEYAAEAGYDNAWIYSMVYNGGFLIFDLTICLVALVVLYLVIPGKKKA